MSVKFWLVRWCMPLFVPFCLTHFSVWQVLFEGEHWLSAMGPTEVSPPPFGSIHSERVKPRRFQKSKSTLILFFRNRKFWLKMARMNQEIAKKAVLLLPEIFRRLGQSISQEGTSHTFKNIKNAPSQTGESFYKLSKEYFLPASQGRKTFHTFKKY